MTKEKMEEKIICLLGYCSEDVINSINNIFEDFARTNVCIPKGTNRHPYADVLHEWVEGATLEYLANLSGKMLEHKSSHFYLSADEYRIKPSEPVYEWQWCLMLKAKNEVTGYMASNNHLIDEEAKEWIQKSVNKEHFLPIKIEETKRVRQ